jgi:DNA-directed RNA polymerase subunit beta'
VGVIAAQSIGEPGTQLTLRTYHTGGIVTKDITQGLPRVEEIFEARSPSTLAVMAESGGRLKIISAEEKRSLLVVSEEKDQPGGGERLYEVDPLAELLVADGDRVEAGQPLTTGHLDLKRLMAVAGITAVQKYILAEIQKVYSTQGVGLNDKHVETVVRQVFSRVRIETPGGTRFLPGEVISRFLLEEENERALREGRPPALARLLLLGITRASLATESFLAAASFQDTTRILTEASLFGKVDHLLGLKENVIIGRLIPTGERARLKTGSA